MVADLMTKPATDFFHVPVWSIASSVQLVSMFVCFCFVLFYDLCLSIMCDQVGVLIDELPTDCAPNS